MQEEVQLRFWGAVVAILGLWVWNGGAADMGSDSDGVVVTQANLQALIAIKRSFQDPERALASWNESGLGACTGLWVGVKCAKGEVIVLQLPGKGLGGIISEQIGQLTALRKLNLHTNGIGGPIPESLTSLQNLRGLYLFHNRLTGNIPAGLGGSPALQAVDLSRNMLEGEVPASIASSSRLFLLNLSFNNLSGAFQSEWASSSSLLILNVASNLLTGPLPDDWGSKGPSRLRSLDASNNLLSGKLPLSIGNLTSLNEFHLENNRLVGSIPTELGHLNSLQYFDMSHNQLNGSIPIELGNLSALNMLNLERNSLTGELPSTFGLLKSLRMLDASDNNLAGQIPPEVGNITGLAILDLSGNHLNGTIPSSLGKLANLTVFNVSNNRLSGQVPTFMHAFNMSSYEGNVGLCGFNASSPCAQTVLSPPPPPPPPAVTTSKASPQKSGRNRGLSTVSLICIVLGSALAFCAAICMLLLLLWKSKENKGQKERAAKAKADPSQGGDVGGKLVHFDGPFAFTADDLLCATAEVMGKSAYGTVYKATLENGNNVIVKRLREGIVKNQREFEVEVNTLGKIRHPNLVALRAYYWGPKDEKLLVFDFMPGGSLAAFLHARGPETPLGWKTRMRIAAGAARGLHYLHEHEKILHGNLTSSNILLDSTLNAVIADYGLARLMTTAASSNVIATASAQGYRAPELTKLKNATSKSDVYSFGIVLLELLTGKAPGEAITTDSGAIDLPDWVSSVVKEEWTSEVFDVELLKGVAPSEDDMLNTLQLAMTCVSATPASRPDMAEVLNQLDEVASDSRDPLSPKLL